MYGRDAVGLPDIRASASGLPVDRRGYIGSATYSTGTSVNSPQFRQARVV